jgi:polyisoprenoid-binding protein YceI
MKRPSTLSALAFLCLGPVFPVAAQGPSSKEAVSYKSSPVRVDLQAGAGSIEFLATGWPSALQIHGKGNGPEGTLTVTDHSVEGSLAVDLRSLQTGIGLRDRHLKENYLQVDRYPQARLTVTRLDMGYVPDGPAFGAVAVPFEGTLLLHGVEKPVSGQARVSRKDGRVTATAQFSIKIVEFGIDLPKYMGITVGEKVEVKTSFSAALERDRDVARR